VNKRPYRATPLAVAIDFCGGIEIAAAMIGIAPRRLRIMLEDEELVPPWVPRLLVQAAMKNDNLDEEIAAALAALREPDPAPAFDPPARHRLRASA
jgi:hypothetical protein